MSRSARLAIVIVVILVIGAGAGLWYFLYRDTSSSTASLDAISASPATSVDPTTSAEGTWKLQTGPNVFVGYRVGETLLPARTQRTVVGRTPAVAGTMTIDGSTVTAAKVTADVTQLKSDEALREKVLETVGLQTATHKTTVFSLTEPLKLPKPPAPGAQVSVVAKGTLEAHGVTKAFQLPLTAKWDGDQISVATVGDGAPFVMADYGVALPKLPISDDDDHGTIEVQLLFTRS